MAKINLLKKDWGGKRQIERFRLATRIMMLLAIGGFLLQTFYVAGRLVYLRTKITKTKREIKSLNEMFESNKDYVSNYVWVQGVLEKIGQEKRDEYKYKDYLQKINSWLTEGTSLIGVSFTKKDEITFLVFAPSVDDYRRFETKLKLKQKEDDFGFKVVEQDSLSRLEDGTYKVKIKLRI